MAAYRRVDDLRSPAGWLPVHRDQLRAQRSVSSTGSLYLFTFLYRIAIYLETIEKLLTTINRGFQSTVVLRQLIALVCH